MNDSDKLSIAVGLLDKQGLIEYERVITAAEQDCEANEFYNVPAECEDFECVECPLDADKQKERDCPYLD